MINDLKKFGEVIEEVELKKYNTYRIGGTAKYLIEPSNIEDLKNLLKYLKDNNIKYILIGNGSNIILNGDYFDGVVITFNKLNNYEINKEYSVLYAEAGAMLPKIAMSSINESLKGLEFAAGIPGTVGGSIYNNAGAYNACILDYVKEITVLNDQLEIDYLTHEDITYGYRTSLFKETKKYIIVAAIFQLEPGDKEASLEVVNNRRVRRVETQPLEYPSAGSVFRNPEGDYAGRLIEECKLKGYQIGGAAVSEKHANFIINKDNATSSDIYNLVNYVHDQVLEKTGVDLIIEQEFIGWK